MGKFAAFTGTFGEPEPGTGVPLADLHLDQFPFLVEYEQEVGSGVSLGGAFSVSSVREQGVNLSAWMHLVPSGSRHFATNGIGELFVVAPNQELYLVMIHSGEVTVLETTPQAFFVWMAEPRNQGLFAALGQFHLQPRSLLPNQILTYEPPAAAGGREDPNTLVPADLNETLARLADIFFVARNE